MGKKKSKQPEGAQDASAGTAAEVSAAATAQPAADSTEELVVEAKSAPVAVSSTVNSESAPATEEQEEKASEPVMATPVKQAPLKGRPAPPTPESGTSQTFVKDSSQMAPSVTPKKEATKSKEVETSNAGPPPLLNEQDQSKPATPGSERSGSSGFSFVSWFQPKSSPSSASITKSKSSTTRPPRIAVKSLGLLIKESNVRGEGTMKVYEIAQTTAVVEAKPVEDASVGLFCKSQHYLVLAGTASNVTEAHFVFPAGAPEAVQVETISAFEADGTAETNVFRQVIMHESVPFRKLFREGAVYFDDWSDRPRMFQVRTHAPFSHMFCEEVPAKLRSLSHSDVFILDLRNVLYVFVGDCADYSEKHFGKSVATRLCASRKDARVSETLDEFFWGQMGGTREQVVLRMSTQIKFIKSKPVDQENASLYWVGHKNGETVTQFLKVHQGRVYPKMLRPQDVYVVDFGHEGFVWVGESAPIPEIHWLRIAFTCFQLQKRAADSACFGLVHGKRPNRAMDSMVYSGRLRHSRQAVDDDEVTVVSHAVHSMTDAIQGLFASCSGERDLEDKFEREWNIVDATVVDMDPALQSKTTA